MGRLPLAGASISILRHSTGEIVVYLEYHLDIDAGIMGRSRELTFKPADGTPGSKEWTRAVLEQVIRSM